MNRNQQSAASLDGQRPYDVFLSFGHPDRRLAGLVDRKLREKGLKVFFLPRVKNVPSADPLSRRVHRALSECAHFVIVGSSPANLQREHVTKEVLAIVDRQQNREPVTASVLHAGDLRPASALHLLTDWPFVEVHSGLDGFADALARRTNRPGIEARPPDPHIHRASWTTRLAAASAVLALAAVAVAYWMGNVAESADGANGGSEAVDADNTRAGNSTELPKQLYGYLVDSATGAPVVRARVQIKRVDGVDITDGHWVSDSNGFYMAHATESPGRDASLLVTRASCTQPSRLALRAHDEWRPSGGLPQQAAGLAPVFRHEVACESPR